ncbi:hypothetical protein ACP70R_050132 [Stipagrostis hirtigluma subsp. patula]
MRTFQGNALDKILESAAERGRQSKFYKRVPAIGESGDGNFRNTWVEV